MYQISFCRLCSDVLCQQLKGWFSVHILLCDITDSTLGSVKADSLFSYQPPVNLFALCVLLPLSYVLTPRWFHKVCLPFTCATSLMDILVPGQRVHDQVLAPQK